MPPPVIPVSSFEYGIAEDALDDYNAIQKNGATTATPTLSGTVSSIVPDPSAGSVITGFATAFDTEVREQSYVAIGTDPKVYLVYDVVDATTMKISPAYSGPPPAGLLLYSGEYEVLTGLHVQERMSAVPPAPLRLPLEPDPSIPDDQKVYKQASDNGLLPIFLAVTRQILPKVSVYIANAVRVNVTPTGAIDGSNTVFTTPESFAYSPPLQRLDVRRNGVSLKEGTDYTVQFTGTAGTGFTMTTPPSGSDWLAVAYVKAP